MVVAKGQRRAAAGAEGRRERGCPLEAIGTEQGRAGRGELLLTAQTAGRKEQLLQGLYPFVQERHGIISIGRSQVFS